MKIQDLTKNDVVRCTTEEQAKTLLQAAHELGYRWQNRLSFLRNDEYSRYQSETCYNIKQGKYAYKDFYYSKGYNVIPFEKMELDKTFELEEGMYIYLKGEVLILALIHHLRNLGYDTITKYSTELKSCYFRYSNNRTFELLDSKVQCTKEIQINNVPNLKEGLPIIDGYKGVLYNDLVVYGPATLKVEWFANSGTRQIKSMVLSSGIEINEQQMEQIRNFINKKS